MSGWEYGPLGLMGWVIGWMSFHYMDRQWVIGHWVDLSFDGRVVGQMGHWVDGPLGGWLILHTVLGSDYYISTFPRNSSSSNNSSSRIPAAAAAHVRPLGE